MSGGVSAATIVGVVGAAAAVGSVVVSANNAKKAAKGQKNALSQAKDGADKQAAAAEKQAVAADQATNAANQKRPNTSEILDAANQAGRAGVSGTMLTGSKGVAPDQLALGRSALLGS